MPERGRKISREISKPSVSASRETRRRSRREKRPAELKTKAMDGPVTGKPSLLQSTYGNVGNFELVVPLAVGGLGHYWRCNDDERLPWEGPLRFGIESGRFDGVSMIQGDFGDAGNLEIAAVDAEGRAIMHFWRDSGESPAWHGPQIISGKSSVPLFSGSPALIWSNLGRRGNFDIVVPRAAGGFSYYWRENDDPALPWCGPVNFATEAGTFDAVTMIQSNFGNPGNLELAARSGDRLVFIWGELSEEAIWHGPDPIATGVAGVPSMIQSTFGNKGHFELVVPLASGGLAYFQRDNDNVDLSWRGPLMFAMNMGVVEGVSLIQSNFGDPGHLELVAQVDGHLAFFWRDSGPDFRWNGPQYLTR